ncbi:hypothetical protein CAPTEDRAFT_146455 [Capitella teleta]|uniref:Fucosyltransferase n=1 Tax=Capitella teleta TaxID=283909 RepID=R7T686_CAPTE|nr:hypothetical protein CAPTEDRAFT_146455 [Capitella teleta]|eukprot:ELT88768.1 hypothetical protein CAPTEDRAFT_146455 [Capitella teleta]
MRCRYTGDHSRLQESNALLFRARQLNFLTLPKRIPDQKWIFYEFEPPYKTWKRANLTQYNGLFNLTATYSFDSDIPIHESVNCVRDTSKLQSLRDVDYTVKKRGDVLVTWFVSICSTQSKREDYVKEMQKHMPVDIYGGCGPLRCGTNTPRNWKREGCLERLLHGNGSYKFYLAFENSFCDDYVSEKLWKVMNLDVVVVVMGAADYSQILPQDSYIDVRNYATPKELADYLRYLDANDEKYNEYIRNKASLKCEGDTQMPFQCKLCKHLHETKGKARVIYDLAEFWGSRRCYNPKEFLRVQANDKFKK